MGYIGEWLVFCASGIYSIVALNSWYKRIVQARFMGQRQTGKYILGFLPIISLTIIYATLVTLASFDVVEDPIYILCYLAMGFAWVFLGMSLVFGLFDISWTDDALLGRNKAALFAVIGAFLGLTVIYAGANVGDGPGWWCVLFAGGLGAVAWFLLGFLVNKLTQVFERISIERDMRAGIRFGSYLLASGLILGRASAGDWTSFTMTLVEFLVGWPVLPLTLIMVLVERSYTKNGGYKKRVENNQLAVSIIWGIIFILVAVLCVVVFPLAENPVYGRMPGGFWG